MSENAWIEHDGGACPVAEDAPVSVRFRDRTTSSAARAGFWSDWWYHRDADFDIIAYRLSGPSA